MLKRMALRLPTDPKEVAEKGFLGNVSGSPRFVTDANVLLLASAILEDVEIKTNETDELIKESQIVFGWEQWTRVPARQAFFVGCCMSSKTDFPLALVSDGWEYIFLNPWKLSFAIQAVAADSMEAAKYKPRNHPVILLREKNPVGVVMPMRGDMALVDRYDISHEPVPLITALRQVVKA